MERSTATARRPILPPFASALAAEGSSLAGKSFIELGENMPAIGWFFNPAGATDGPTLAGLNPGAWGNTPRGGGFPGDTPGQVLGLVSAEPLPAGPAEP